LSQIGADMRKPFGDWVSAVFVCQLRLEDLTGIWRSAKRNGNNLCFL